MSFLIITIFTIFARITFADTRTVPQGYCQTFTNGPYQISSEGMLLDSEISDWSKETKANVVIYSNPKLGKDILTLDNGRRLISRTLERKSKKSNADLIFIGNLPIKQIDTYEYLNNICIRSRQEKTYETDSAGYPLKTSITVETKNLHLCYELKEYLKKHKELLKCSCGNPQTDTHLQSIFAKYKIPNKVNSQSKRNTGEVTSVPIYESQFFSNISHTLPSEAVLKVMAQPLQQAAMALGNCFKDRRDVEALSDKKIWGTLSEKDNSSDNVPSQR